MLLFILWDVLKEWFFLRLADNNATRINYYQLNTKQNIEMCKVQNKPNIPITVLIFNISVPISRLPIKVTNLIWFE